MGSNSNGLASVCTLQIVRKVRSRARCAGYWDDLYVPPRARPLRSPCLPSLLGRSLFRECRVRSLWLGFTLGEELMCSDLGLMGWFQGLLCKECRTFDLGCAGGLWELRLQVSGLKFATWRLQWFLLRAAFGESSFRKDCQCSDGPFQVVLSSVPTLEHTRSSSPPSTSLDAAGEPHVAPHAHHH